VLAFAFMSRALAVRLRQSPLVSYLLAGIVIGPFRAGFVGNAHGIAGLAEVASPAYTDASQFDRSSPYYDPKSKKEAPRWVNVEVRALRKTRLVALAELRRHKSLAKMTLLRPGNRLSITPVSAAEWKYITDRLI